MARQHSLDVIVLQAWSATRFQPIDACPTYPDPIILSDPEALTCAAADPACCRLEAVPNNLPVRDTLLPAPSLGYLYHRTGEARLAAIHLAEALEIYRALGDRYFQADTLAHLGDAAADNGDDVGARYAWSAALEIFDNWTTRRRTGYGRRS